MSIDVSDFLAKLQEQRRREQAGALAHSHVEITDILSMQPVWLHIHVIYFVRLIPINENLRASERNGRWKTRMQLSRLKSDLCPQEMTNRSLKPCLPVRRLLGSYSLSGAWFQRGL
jgi:hypothetical protein